MATILIADNNSTMLWTIKAIVQQVLSGLDSTVKVITVTNGARLNLEASRLSQSGEKFGIISDVFMPPLLDGHEAAEIISNYADLSGRILLVSAEPEKASTQIRNRFPLADKNSEEFSKKVEAFIRDLVNS
jgi:CheY-like chemotaxis protein